jgi:hypothetical protein
MVLEELEPRTLLSITFTQLTNVPPNGDSLSAMFLLSNGKVLVSGGGDSASSNWYTLSPDSSGNYFDGTWTQVASSNYQRLFFGSTLLENGNLVVSGGEYGSGGPQAEVYNPVNNTWTTTPSPNGGNSMSDDSSTILPNGNYMAQNPFGPVHVYNPSTNSWSTTGSVLSGGNEEAWVQQPDGTILKIDGYGDTTSERYLPAQGQWFSMGTTPNNVWDSNGEEGPGMLLTNQKTIFFGASGLTNIYTPGPAGSTTPGTWAAGPNMPSGVLPDDAPAAQFPDGNILIAGDTGKFNGPTTLAEYNPNTNSFSSVSNAPANGNGAFVNHFLCLPNGQILYNEDGPTAWVVSESGSPSSGQPTISSITQNGDGSFTLTGTQLNGITEGAGYGDDYRPSTNYPIVKLVSGSNVYYARTYNWNNTGVDTGSTAVSTNFALPAGIPNGTYLLYVVANGVASNATRFSVGSASITPGVYTIKNLTSSLFLDAPNNSQGTGIDQAGGGGTNQQWNIQPSGHYYTLTNVSSGLVPDDPAGSTTQGTQMVQWSANGGLNQLWSFQSAGNGQYIIVNAYSNLVLDDSGGSTASGNPIIQWADNVTSNQEWSLAQPGITPGHYYIKNLHSGLVADDPGGSTQQGTQIVQWGLNNGSNQDWNIQPSGNFYTIQNVASGLYLDDSNNSKSNNNPIIQWGFNGGANQLWSFKSVGGGEYNIINDYSGLNLDVSGDSTSPGAGLVQFSSNGQTDQEWSLSGAPAPARPQIVRPPSPAHSGETPMRSSPTGSIVLPTTDRVSNPARDELFAKTSFGPMKIGEHDLLALLAAQDGSKKRDFGILD